MTDVMTKAEKQILAEIFPHWEKYTLQAADLQTDFFESGGDSLSAINMIVELQKNFSIEISLEQFMRTPTLIFLLSKTKSWNKVS